MEQFELHAMLAKDCIALVDLPLSSLLLMNDAQYPWFILVPRVANVKDIYQLEWDAQQQFLNESSMLSEVLMETFKGKKMNVAALGNICPQLHVHHIVRFEDDIAWPNPVWGAFPAKPYTNAEVSAIKERVLPSIEAILKKY